MVELMEQSASARNPDNLKVTNPDIWADCPAILSFLADTATHSLDELLEHVFLSHEGKAESFCDLGSRCAIQCLHSKLPFCCNESNQLRMKENFLSKQNNNY